ncbi:hypothetical protein JQR84_23515 (plasmid) [Pseudomonas luteola]|uniref:hypothetical protein n=1 Tax=Pseudomonas TaxID=286 RepID=UPI003DA15D54
MKNSMIAISGLFALSIIGNTLAGTLSKGRDNRGVTLEYEGLEMGSNSAVRFSLKCVKNWGGEVTGAASVVAFYIDKSNILQQVSNQVSCHVKGGLDGARKSRSGEVKTITIPVPIAQAQVRAYIDYQEISNTEAAVNHLQGELNKIVEKSTLGLVKKPLSMGTSLEQAVIPAGGDKLAF